MKTAVTALLVCLSVQLLVASPIQTFYHFSDTGSTHTVDSMSPSLFGSSPVHFWNVYPQEDSYHFNLGDSYPIGNPGPQPETYTRTHWFVVNPGSDFGVYSPWTEINPRTEFTSEENPENQPEGNPGGHPDDDAESFPEQYPGTKTDDSPEFFPEGNPGGHPDDDAEPFPGPQTDDNPEFSPNGNAEKLSQDFSEWKKQVQERIKKIRMQFNHESS